MPEISRSYDQITQKNYFTFATTPKMSTYLLSLVVSNYDFFEDKTGVTPVRVYTVPSEVENAKYAANFGSKVLSYFNNYFNISVIFF